MIKKSIWQTLLILALSLNANAGPNNIQDRLRSGHTITELIIKQTETFNNGKYAIIENKTQFDKYKTKNIEATCPAGMRAVSAGYSAASGAGEPKDYRVILSKPTNDGTGWSIYARFDSSGDLLAADFEWELRISVVCIKQ
jgi:hypothetical protein